MSLQQQLGDRRTQINPALARVIFAPDTPAREELLTALRLTLQKAMVEAANVMRLSGLFSANFLPEMGKQPLSISVTHTPDTKDETGNDNVVPEDKYGPGYDY